MRRAHIKLGIRVTVEGDRLEVSALIDKLGLAIAGVMAGGGLPPGLTVSIESEGINPFNQEPVSKTVN